MDEGDFSQILFWNLYADIFCSDSTSRLPLRSILEKFLAGDLQHGRALHTKMTCEGTRLTPGWLWVNADKNTMRPKLVSSVENQTRKTDSPCSSPAVL